MSKINDKNNGVQGLESHTPMMQQYVNGRAQD